MDEDEELFRLMNEEDDLYMGDVDDSSNIQSSNNGCAGMLSVILFLEGILIFLTMQN